MATGKEESVGGWEGMIGGWEEKKGIREGRGGDSIHGDVYIVHSFYLAYASAVTNIALAWPAI